MWRTWPNASERSWWPRLRWRSTRGIQRCWWTCSTASPSLTPARPNYARPGWTAWPESMWRTETCQRSVYVAELVELWCNGVTDFISVYIHICPVYLVLVLLIYPILFYNIIKTINITLLIWPELFLSFTGGHVLRARRSTCGGVPAEERCFDNLFALAHHTAALLCRFCIFRADCYNVVSSHAVRRHDQAGLLSVPCRDSKHRWRSSDDGGRRHAGRPLQWSTCY